jgi:hypothetical protein
MLRALARWILRNETSIDDYLKGWSDGVNQLHYEPKSAWHGIIFEREYWGEE